MIGERVASSFPRLGHQIGDVDARGFRTGDGFGNLRDKQIGKDAGVKRAGAEKDKVGVLDGIDSFGKRADVARGKSKLLDGDAAGGDAGFTVHDAATIEGSNEVN